MSKLAKNVHLVAGTPAQMQESQQELVQWSLGKLEAERAELAEAEENLRIARESKWRVRPWQARVRKHKQRLTFYAKVKAALEAGYYIIPPFPVQVFAIRTDKTKPKHEESTWPSARFTQGAKALPEGQGHWLSPNPEVWQSTINSTDREGNEVEKTIYYPEKFTEVDFPFRFVKPKVIEETAKAMKTMVFDQLGVLPRYALRGDPIVVGQIKHPTSHSEPLTFFVAWWLNTEEL